MTGQVEHKVMLGLLEAVAANEMQSQRRLAAELGVALGLVNAYLNRCIKKGMVKVRAVPANRYAYFLTREGFAEKARLTATYLSEGLAFFRRAREECQKILSTARRAGYNRIVLSGASDFSDIALICGPEEGVEIVGIVDLHAECVHAKPGRAKMYRTIEDVDVSFHAVVVTDFRDAEAAYKSAVAFVSAERVFIPKMLAGALKKAENA